MDGGIRKSGRGCGGGRGASATPATSLPASTSSHVAARKKLAAKVRADAAVAFDRSIRSLIPESELYTQLLDFEHTIDRTLTRRRAEAEDAQPAVSSRMHRNLRIVASRSAQSPGVGCDPAQPQGWALKLYTQIEGDPQVDGKVALSQTTICDYFRRITIELDRNVFPEANYVEWNKGKNAPVEGFELRKSSTVPCDVTIILELDHKPPRYKLSKQLQDVLNVPSLTTSATIRSLWRYIKANGLQDPKEPSSVICDAKLHRLFGSDTVQISEIAGKIQYHIAPLDPIEIKFCVDPSVEAVEDVRVIEVEATRDHPSNLNQNLLKDTQVLDDEITKLIEEINHRKYKREFMLAFAKSPGHFVCRLIAAQARDYRAKQIDGRPHLPSRTRTPFVLLSASLGR